MVALIKNMVKIIKNTARYLSSSIIQKCFIKGVVTNVDKQVCGNGFSTAFLNLPVEKNKVNIIIAPNKAVLIEKKNKAKNFINRVKFFYAESIDDDFTGADVLFFVADSFLLRENAIKNISNKIDKVLIDENHSTEQQTSFRYKLVDFESKVKQIISNTGASIVKVTASPNHYSDVDIRIQNKHITPIEINHSSDRLNAINRIKEDIANNENVVVFSNSSTTIYHLRNYKNEINANFIIGENLKRNLVELATIIEDEESNLTVVSSRGFEGFDIYYKDSKVYYFEDRSNDFETFYISNLYQAINRTRSGAKYVEYCRQELSNKRKEPFKNIDIEVNDFINNNGLTVEEKQKREYKKYHRFVIFNQDSNGVFSIKQNDVAIKLYKEGLIFDKPFPQAEFKTFLEQREISVNRISDVNNRLTKKVKNSQKVKNLFNNKDLIDKYGLFDEDYTINVLDAKSHTITVNDKYRLLYLKRLQDYLRRKNYNGNYIIEPREKNALELLKNDSLFYKLVNDVTKQYDARSIQKYGIKASEKYRLEFRSKSINTVALFILSFANRRIYLPSKWVANRNYNLSVEIGVEEIQIIANSVGVDVLEIDVKNCFVRILYALCGKQLPNNFYGANKENKIAINIYLNNFFYDKKKKIPKKDQRYRAKTKFRKYGFDEDVIEYLMINFFDCKSRGDLFNRLSFYEKRLISITRDCCDLDNTGIIRRHDSILVFDNKVDLSFINSHTYLDISGWFDVECDPDIRQESHETLIIP